MSKSSLLEHSTSHGRDKEWLRIISLHLCGMATIPCHLLNETKDAVLFIPHLACLEVYLEGVTSWISVVLPFWHRACLHYALLRFIPLSIDYAFAGSTPGGRSVILTYIAFICYWIHSNFPTEIIHISSDYENMIKHPRTTLVIIETLNNKAEWNQKERVLKNRPLA